MGKTSDALMARGFDSKTAKLLEESGHTLKSLKSLNADELLALNISEELVHKILREPRPPIPPEILNKVLYESKMTCCVCRDQSQGIIVHHIHEYSDSRSHAEDNLVVLCLNHHGEAHTKRQIQLNLTPERLLEFKTRWLEDVRHNDTLTILSKSPSSYSVWDYFNHHRLIELANNLEINMHCFPNYSQLVQEKLIYNDGTPAWQVSLDSHYLYELGRLSYAKISPYFLYSEIIETVLKKTNWINLYPSNWNHSFVNSMIKEGSLVVCKGAFYFKNLGNSTCGTNQMRRALRRSRGIHLEFVFDAWETTSSSAYAVHLSSHSVTTAVCLIRSKSIENKQLMLRASVLAMGNGFGPSHKEYKEHHRDDTDLDLAQQPDEVFF